MFSMGGLVLNNDLLFIRVCFLKKRSFFTQRWSCTFTRFSWCLSHRKCGTRLVRRAGGGGEGILKMTDACRRRAQCFTAGTETPFMCVWNWWPAMIDLCSRYTSESCSTTQRREEEAPVDMGCVWLMQAQHGCRFFSARGRKKRKEEEEWRLRQRQGSRKSNKQNS